MGRVVVKKQLPPFSRVLYGDALERQQLEIVDVDAPEEETSMSMDDALTKLVREEPCPVISRQSLPWRTRIVFAAKGGCRLEVCSSHAVLDGNGIPRFFLQWLRAAQDIAERIGACGSDTTPEAVARLFDGPEPPPDVLINAAAFTAVDLCESEEIEAVRVNGEGPGLLAEQCRAAGVGLGHVSTDYVLAGDGRSPQAL